MGFWNRLFGQKAAAPVQRGRAKATPVKAARATPSAPTQLSSDATVAGSNPTQNEAESHIKIGAALRSKGDIKGAIEAYRKAIRIKPDYAEAHSKLGAALCDAGDQDGGALECREAIRLRPDDFAAAYYLGNALYHKGDFSGAIAEFRGAIRLVVLGRWGESRGVLTIQWAEFFGSPGVFCKLDSQIC